MANFTDRLKVIVDWDGKSAETGLGRFRDAVRNADTTTGKFKAGANAAFTSLQANVGTMAVAAGAALVTFGMKAADAFSDSAKAALDLGNATGFSTEQASRWIAVADDYQVSADAIASSVGRIAKDLDSSKWEKYGIATRDAAGNARSANDIFLDVLDVLAKTPNETERARIAAQLLGKGWQGIAPMIGQTRDEYEKMLDSVDEGQVVTEEEARKAERWRLAQDKLAEAFGEAQMAIGEFVSELAPLISGLSDVVFWANKVGVIETAARGSALGMNDLGSAAEWAAKHVENTAEAVTHVAELSEVYRKQLEKTEFDLDKSTRAHDGLADSALGVADAFKAVEKAEKELFEARRAQIDSTFALRDAQDDLTESLEDLASAQDDPTTAVNEADRAMRDAERAALDYADSMLRLAEDQATARGETLTTAEKQDVMVAALGNVLSTLEPGSPLYLAIQGYIKMLQSVPTRINTEVSINGQRATVGTGGNGVPLVIAPGGGAGGPVRFHDGGVVPGPHGAEVPAILKAGETVLPTHKGPMSVEVASAGAPVTNNWYIDARGMDPDEMVRALQEHLRRNGGSL